jgi:uncharacterized protein (TIGR02118 family)
MVKLVALYRAPEDKEGFLEKYNNEHLPLAKQMPGLIKAEVYNVKSLGANKYFLCAELYFENEDALNAAMGSTEGRAAAKNLMSFAKDFVEMHIAELKEK